MGKYVIGVDGGGTKTETVAYSLDGEVLGKVLTGFGNLVNGKDEALRNINAGVEELINKLGKEDLAKVYLGLAGSEVGNNAQIVQDELKNKFNIDAVVMNDSELALKAMLKGNDGILTIAGTGSISFGINKGTQFKCGGWGQLLGDEGAAYKISIEAFKNMIHEYDYGIGLSNLSKAILESLDLNDVDDIVGFVYSKTKDEIASICPIVSKFAENGDKIALEIMKNEATAIAKTTARVYEALEFEECQIGLVGGVIRKSKVARETFETYLKEKVNVTDFVDDEVSAAMGAYYIFLKENK